MNYQVLRLDSSSYQDSIFFEEEKDGINAIQGVEYISSTKSLKNDASLILITNTHSQPDKISDFILNKTKLIIHPNSGYDNFSTDFIKKFHAPIILGNPIRKDAVVEFILSAIFHHFVPIPSHQFWSDTRTWSRKLLRDSNIIILGHGHIGKKLESCLSPLVKKLSIFDPYKERQLDENQLGVVLSHSSIVIFASSLNRDNYHFFSQKLLNLLPAQCLIINAARGGLIDENALTEFLKKHPSAQAYLDVFEQEPFRPGHLHEVKNLNKTSHIAGVHKYLNKDIIKFEKEVIENFVHHNDKFYQRFENCLLENRLVDGVII